MMHTTKKHYVTRSILLLVFFFCLSPFSVTAQIWKNLGRKVERKIENEASRRAERRIDQAINKSMDRVEKAADDAARKDKKEQKTKPVSIPGVYKFSLGVTYHMRDGGSGKPTETSMWFSDTDYIGISVPVQEDVFMIMQGADMITFMKKEKKYMVLGSGFTKGILGAAVENSAQEDVENVSIKKIGTERILGFLCDIYEVKSSEYTTKIWLTKELGIDGSHFMSAFSNVVKSGPRLPNLKNQAGGLLLKMEGVGNTKKKDVMMMEAKEVHRQGMQFNTSGYTNLGF